MNIQIFIMSDFLEVLLYIVIGFWILRLLLKLAMPYLLKYFVKYVSKKTEQKFNSNQQNPFNNPSQSNKTQKSKKPDQKLGEYIDYEEID